MADTQEQRSPQLPLPPGQSVDGEFPRFGLNQFADRFPAETSQVRLTLGGDVKGEPVLDDALQALPIIEQHSDFHCVTTWSATDLLWRGYRFADVYEQFIRPRIPEGVDIQCVTFRCQDGYRITSLLEDLLLPEVLLATHLNGEGLGVSHGAPVRLVAPAQYGYKNPKHIKVIECWGSLDHYTSPQFTFMDHPRARVVHEERGRYLPGAIYRWLYRPLVKSTVRKFHKALHRQGLE